MSKIFLHRALAIGAMLSYVVVAGSVVLWAQSIPLRLPGEIGTPDLWPQLLWMATGTFGALSALATTVGATLTREAARGVPVVTAEKRPSRIGA